MTDPDTELERLRAAFNEGDAPAGSCPAPEEIWAAAAGTATPHATRRMIDHLASCSSCSAAWRLACELPREARDAPAPRGNATALGARRLAGYAAALALAVLAALALRPETPAEPTLRAGTSPEIVSALDEREPVRRDELTLRWRGVSAGSVCRVTLADRELRSIFELGGLASAEARVPAAALAGQAAGALLYWQVQCEPTQGEPIASATFRVRLAD